jgi:beta-lactamase class A
MRFMRLSALLVLSAACAFEARAEINACQIDGEFQKIIFQTMGEARALSDTSYGLMVIKPSSGEILCQEFVQPEQNIYPASSIKTLIAMAVLRGVDAGILSLEQEVKIDQVNASDECKDWGCDTYGPGKIVTVRKLLHDMITISNNLATNQLIDVATRPWINDTAKAAMAPTLEVNRKVYNTVDPEPNNPLRNRATASGLVQLYREIAAGNLHVLLEPSRAHLVTLLSEQKINNRLNARFPAEIKFHHKTGSTSKTSSDGGFYFLGSDSAVILVGLQNFNVFKECQPTCVEKSGFEFLRQIGKATLDLTLEFNRAYASH